MEAFRRLERYLYGLFGFRAVASQLVPKAARFLCRCHHAIIQPGAQNKVGNHRWYPDHQADCRRNQSFTDVAGQEFRSSHAAG
jgi:hypothetical protein